MFSIVVYAYFVLYKIRLSLLGIAIQLKGQWPTIHIGHVGPIENEKKSTPSVLKTERVSKLETYVFLTKEYDLSQKRRYIIISRLKYTPSKV